MKSSERCFKIVNILYQRRYETIRNLALELNVSQRTILRDINKISALVPIYTRTGRYHGGIYIMDHCSALPIDIDEMTRFFTEQGR